MTTTIFSSTLDTDGDGNDGYTFVCSFAAAGLTLPAGDITGVKVTFQASNAQVLQITNAYIGHAAAAGDAYDFLATPVQLLFATAGTKDIAAGTSETTDLAVFAYNKTSALLISFYVGGGATKDNNRFKTGVANVNDYYKAAVSEAATVDKTGYTLTAGYNRAINKIEVESTGGWFMMWS